jgi:hypothetical protein
MSYKRALFLLAGGVAVALHLGGARPASAAPAAVDKIETPIFSFNTCNGELVVGTVQIHTVVRQGSDGCLDIAVSIHGTGIGFDPLTQQPTGNSYQFNGNARATQCGEFCPSTLVDTVYTRLIGQGATPNDYVRIYQIVAFDEQCLITTWLMEISSECRG